MTKVEEKGLIIGNNGSKDIPVKFDSFENHKKYLHNVIIGTAGKGINHKIKIIDPKEIELARLADDFK